MAHRKSMLDTSKRMPRWFWGEGLSYFLLVLCKHKIKSGKANRWGLLFLKPSAGHRPATELGPYVRYGSGTGHTNPKRTRCTERRRSFCELPRFRPEQVERLRTCQLLAPAGRTVGASYALAARDKSFGLKAKAVSCIFCIYEAQPRVHE